MRTLNSIRRVFFVGAISLFVSAASVSDEMPQDVQNFVEQYRLCEHFRGEHTGGSSPERDQHVNEQLAEVCPIADRSLIHLRDKYTGNPEILSFLSGFSCSTSLPNCD